MTIGVKQVKKAGMWCAYCCKNKATVADDIYWLATEAEARVKLAELLKTYENQN